MRILITGCSKGIGMALAERFLDGGWEVCATARNVEMVKAVSWAGKCLVAPLDVCSDDSVEEAVRFVSTRWDSLDVLVNNAAIFPGEGDESLEDVDLAWFGEALETNVTGVARVTRACLPLLRAAADPRVANISSGAASISEKEDYGYYAYAVSKAALNMLTRAMAAEFPKVIISAISPGWVKTEMGGPNATITTQESAESLFRTITTLRRAQSGQFFGRDGGPYAW